MIAMVPRRHRRLLAAALACTLVPACGIRGRSIPTILPVVSGATTKIYAADGTLITELQGDEQRVSITLDQIPHVLQNAVIAIEDERFWEHDSVDPRGVVRAAKENSDGGSQGGSTITQQYIKNTLLSPERSLQRKVQEASLAYQLERQYSKAFILEQYLNTIFFGNRAYGVQQASLRYFGHPVAAITLPEAALLAGLVQSPTRMNPYVHPDAALKRRNLVLGKLAELGYIGTEEADAAKLTPLALAPLAPPATTRYPAAHFVEEVKRFIRTDPRFGKTAAERENLLLNGGLSISTSIDLNLQAKAEKAATDEYPSQRRAIKDRRKDPDIGLVAIDPKSGYVRAMVGGYDYFDDDTVNHPYAQVNLAVGGGRQSGSTFKLVVLAAALAAGVSPTATFPAPGSTVIRYPGQAAWKVSGESGGAKAPLLECVVHSLNTCFGNLIADKRVGPDGATAFAAKMGIDTSYNPTTDVGFKPYLSLVLGTNNSTVLDMTEAYTVFANRGIHVDPVLVTKVVDATGTVRYQSQRSQQKLLEPEDADAATQMMEQVLIRGTAAGRGIDRPAAGKTGTTQDETDAWFVGFTPDLVTGVWAGYAQTTKRKVGSTGATAAAPVWQRFMKAALADVPPTPFDYSTKPITPTTTVPKSNTAIFEPLAASAPKTVTMPAVAGLSVPEANSRAQSAGLKLRRVDLAMPGVAPGQVLSQSPAPGTAVPRGATVTVEATPGTPVPTGPIPDMVGQVARDALPKVANAGYEIAQVIEAAPDGFVLPLGAAPASGVIWATSPAAGGGTPDGKITVRIQP